MKILLILLLVTAIVLLKKRASDPDIVTGGLYTKQDENGKWKVYQVVRSKNGMVSTRLFSNRFDSKPMNVNTNDLTTAMTLEDLEKGNINLGISEVPIDRDGFLSENFTFIKRSRLIN